MFYIKKHGWRTTAVQQFSLKQPPHLNCNFTKVYQVGRKGGGVAAIFKTICQCKQISLDELITLIIFALWLKKKTISPSVLLVFMYRLPKYCLKLY